MQDWDYEGYAIRYNTKRPDGKTILKDAFKNCDGQTVPLVYNFYQNGGTHIPDTSIDNVLGLACLENREEGVYARCKLNDTPICLELKKVGLDKCIKKLTVFAQRCEIHDLAVSNGIITAVKVISL